MDVKKPVPVRNTGFSFLFFFEALAMKSYSGHSFISGLMEMCKGVFERQGLKRRVAKRVPRSRTLT